MYHVRHPVAVIVAIALLLAACGGGDDDQDTASTGDDTEAATNDPGTSGDAATDDDGAGDQPASGDADSDWCRAVRDAQDQEAGPLDFDLIGLTPAELEEQFTRNVAVLEQWESQAPPEIADEVSTLVDAFRSLVEVAEQAEWDLLVLASDPAFLEAFDLDELGAAAETIDAYSRDVCGVDLGVGGAVDAGGGAAPAPSIPSGDGDVAEQLMGAFGLPATMLSPEQAACVNEQLGELFPEGLPADILTDQDAFDSINEVAESCGLPFG